MNEHFLSLHPKGDHKVVKIQIQLQYNNHVLMDISTKQI